MEELSKTAFSLVAEVKHNLSELLAEWRNLQEELLSSSHSSTHSAVSSPPEHQLVPCHGPVTVNDQHRLGNGVGNGDKCLSQETLLVQRSDLEKLSTEAMMLKEFLPKVLNHDYVAMVGKLSHVEQELVAAVREKDMATSECEHLKRRTEALMTDCEQEKREKFETRSQLSELNDQLSQQADYCSSLGSASCTLLWRVSQREDCIHSILSGSKVDEFLQLVSSTLQSYQVTYSDGLPEDSSEEAQFVLALCGIITRKLSEDFNLVVGENPVITSVRRHLEETICLVTPPATPSLMCSVLSWQRLQYQLNDIVDYENVFTSNITCTTSHTNTRAKLKNLILMSLFNISINQKGLRYLISKPGLMETLVWIIQDETDADNKLHALKLLQSLLLEPTSVAAVQQALQVIPMSLLQSLSGDSNTQIQDIATELMSDLKSLAAQLQTYTTLPNDTPT